MIRIKCWVGIVFIVGTLFSSYAKASQVNVVNAAVDGVSTITLVDSAPWSDRIELTVAQSLRGPDWSLDGIRGIQVMIIPLNLNREDFSDAATCRPRVRAKFSFDGLNFGDIGQSDITFGEAVNPRAKFLKIHLEKSCGLSPRYQLARYTYEHEGKASPNYSSYIGAFLEFENPRPVTLTESSPTGPVMKLWDLFRFAGTDYKNVPRPAVVLSLNNPSSNNQNDPNRCRPSVTVEYSLDGITFGAMDTIVTFGGVIPPRTKFARLRAKRTCGQTLNYVTAIQDQQRFSITSFPRSPIFER